MAVQQEAPKSRPAALRLAISIAGIYMMAAGAWIAGSDAVVGVIAASEAMLTTLQTYKGGAFVLVTGVLLLGLIYTSCRRLEAAQREKDENHNRLRLALGSARGGVWDRDLRTGSLHISPPLKAMIGFREDELSSSSREWAARVHPDDLALVRESTRRAIEMPARHLHHVQYRMRHKDGSWKWFQSRAEVLTDARGEPVRMIGVALDVTEQVEAERRLTHLMAHDPVTGLPKRHAFVNHLDASLEAGQPPGRHTVLARIDVDRFKVVNDRFGSLAGDTVLQAIANRIRHAVGANGLVGHIAGDEFVVAVPDLDAPMGTHRLVKKLSSAFETPFNVGAESVRLSVSVGAGVCPGDGDTAEDLLKSAAIALSTARQDGHGRARFFAPGMDRDFRIQAARASDLRHAVQRGELEVHYQPIVGLGSGRTIGFEALVRWRRPGEGLVPPNEFIGLAEDLGFIGELGDAVLRTACEDALTWSQEGAGRPYVAVNVSPRQFDEPDFIDGVRRVLDETGLGPERLELEITETALARDPEIAARRIDELRGMGIAIAIDDFGTGYSSLGALHRLPLSRLKIDKTFIDDYGVHEGSSVIVDTILGLAKALNVPTTAEGVETEWQLTNLRRKGATAAQGYLFSRPVPREQVPPLLDRDWLNGSAEVLAGTRRRVRDNV